MTDHIYDIETYPNFFSLASVNTDTGEINVFECSARANNTNALKAHINDLAHRGDRLVGFNNVHFDYPVLHHVMQHDIITAQAAYQKAQEIINASDDDRFKHIVWERDRLVQQIDLFKIHHFDNRARSTSLKMLEFNMRAPRIEDLPFPPGTVLTPEQMDVVLAYNIDDIRETWRFYLASLERIRFREELSARYDRDFMNHNDTKIGKDYFIMELNAAGIPTKGPNKEPLQTKRPSINLADAVLPRVRFDHPELNRILSWFKTQTITETKGVFNDLSCTVNGFTFIFGLGGIHGSIDNRIVESDRESVIVDLDVTSYYPNLAIANRVYPAHLGEVFCDIYRDVFEQRKQFPKGSAENAMLKLALNGVYGDSNNRYSPFYDPLYTMTITINGQLLLCMLAEWLMVDKYLEMIQINTDGLTIKIPRGHVEWVEQVCKRWEEHTGLQLESNRYGRMFIRDVNNYIAEYEDGTLKRKGAYCYGSDLDWNQNHGAQIVAKAVEAHLVRNQSLDDFIRGHSDFHDFFQCTKVPRNSHLIAVDDDDNEHMLSNITRYYMSATGYRLVKCMPPLAGKSEWRRIGINVGHKVTPCNDVRDAVVPINHDWYIGEAMKLCQLRK